MGQGAQDRGAPALVQRSQPTLHLGQGLSALGLGLGGDQIGQALDLGQIQFAVVERAAGEFAGLRRPEPVETGQGRRHRPDRRDAAVNMQLGHVLAAVTGRSRKQKSHCMVDCLSLPGPP